MNLPSRRAPTRRTVVPGLHKELAMQTAKWMLDALFAAVAVTAPLAVQAEGLKAYTDTVPWARWETRFALGTPTPTWRTGFDGFGRGNPGMASARLMGDYYFSRSLAAGGVASGFRATSGLIVGPRNALWMVRPYDMSSRLTGFDATLDTATQPYVGIGYSGISLRGGWSVSADLGLLALAPGNAVKLGRVLGGTQGVDELLRDLRLSPVLQLGVSYSF